jgi:hypothetical protein
MDKFKHKEGFGSVFGNDKKQNESQPDFIGDALWRGETVRIAFWKKKDKNGKTYLSLKLSEEYKKPDSEPEVERTRPVINDDLPF